MPSSAPPVQLYAIRAVTAPLAVVFARRGPWVQVARWSLTSGTVTRGAWFRGTIYQRRCDVSPDGELLSYFGMKGGKPFHAISRVPYLAALAFWKADDTYTRGHHFEPAGTRPRDRAVSTREELKPLAKRHGLVLVANDSAAYGAERRRGWTEHPNAPRRSRSDHFDERRPQHLVRTQPSGTRVLELRDDGYTHGRFEGRAPRYLVDDEPLSDVTWADWDARGRLLVALRGGVLEIRGERTRVHARYEFAEFTPAPRPAPAAATRW